MVCGRKSVKTQKDTYKWYILGLVVLTNMLVVAVPMMGIAAVTMVTARSLVTA